MSPVETLPACSSPTDLYAELKQKVQTLRPKEDLSALDRAYRLAADAHKGQCRDDGSPFMLHPLHVAHLLADMHMDLVCLQTGLLHDTVEDTSVGIERIGKEFGEEVERCVDGVTKLKKLEAYSREERQAESVRKMLLATVKDIRVVIVKLADRLHNMRTLGNIQDSERRQRIAQETLDIYAPIAHRLGMGKIRGELEDLSFEYLEPEAWAHLKQEIESKRQENEQALKRVQHDIEVNLAREGIPATVKGRVKRAYSVYQKLKRQKISLDQVYDLLALRIVTDSVKNCYAALGVIHNEWHPIPGRIKDFIAIPRANLYQSLHTSVIGPDGTAFEVQIRTEEMHRVAEEGIAAHWKYKEGKKGPAVDEQRMAWLRQLVDWMQEMKDPGEFMSTLRVDLYTSDDVYAFTPRGRVVTLPRDSTPIDFAYAIHTDVGHACAGAKVNGRIVPLRYTLKNGDIVEIITQPGHQPSKDWLPIVKTPRARNKIRHVINASERAKAIDLGEKYLEREARRVGVQLGRIDKTDFERVAADYGVSKMEDLYAALGYGKYSPRQVLEKLAPERLAEPEPVKVPPAARPEPKDLVIKVSGMDDLLIYRAKCCNPIRGQSIVGFVTRGKGVAVHSVNCTNVQSLMYDPERKIDVEWAGGAEEIFAVKVAIQTDDRPGMLHNITSLLVNEKSNIRSLEARSDEKRNGDGAIVDMTIEIKDQRQLSHILAGIRRISGVRDVQRIG